MNFKTEVGDRTRGYNRKQEKDVFFCEKDHKLLHRITSPSK